MHSIAKYEPYLYLLPAISILCVFLLFPFVWNIYISTHGVSITTILKEWEFVGLDNFIQVLNDSNFHTSIKISVIFVGGFCGISVFDWSTYFIPIKSKY